MLSTSLETQARGDEGQRCSQLSQYRSAVRVPRDLEDVEMKKTPEMANVRRRLHQKFGRYQNEDEEQAEEHAEEPEEANDEVAEEVEGELTEIGEQSVDIASNLLSQCPVENGVVQSQWGAFSAGSAIAGIAAGLVPQTVNIRDLINEEHMGNYRMARQQTPVSVDNRFAATLSGDIAEAVLRQPAGQNIQIGASGAWNNSAVPRWFFLSQRERLEMTDAEIRGGLDGLILATNIVQWRDRFQGLRLSQVLDMYFSQRGMFGMTNDETAIRACNRRALFPIVAPMETLRNQAFAFTTVLDGEMQTAVTLTPVSTQRMATQASDALQTYIGKSAPEKKASPMSFRNSIFSQSARLLCKNENTFFITSFLLLLFSSCSEHYERPDMRQHVHSTRRRHYLASCNGYLHLRRCRLDL